MAVPKNKSDIWMPLYVSDYMADTMHLSTELHGAYCLLLMAAWKSEGRLPNDPEQLQAITRMSAQKWRASERILSNFFVVCPECWTQNRVLKELEKAQKNTEKRAISGKKGAESRWQTHGKRMANG